MSTAEDLCKILEKISVDCLVHTYEEDVEWVLIVDNKPFGRVDVVKASDDEIYKVILYHVLPKNVVVKSIERHRVDEVKDVILRTIMQQGYIPEIDEKMVINGVEVGVVYSGYKILYLKEKSVERLIDEIFHMLSLNLHIGYVVSSNLEGGNNEDNEDRGVGNMYA